MGLDAQAMVDVIVSGTTGYLVEFLPVGAFIAGLVLAFVVGEWLIELLADLYHYKKYSGGDGVSFSQYRKAKAQPVDEV